MATAGIVRLNRLSICYVITVKTSYVRTAENWVDPFMATVVGILAHFFLYVIFVVMILNGTFPELNSVPLRL